MTSNFFLNNWFTYRDRRLHGWRLLVVQLLTANGKEDGEPLLAIDNLGAGESHRVIISNDGAGAAWAGVSGPAGTGGTPAGGRGCVRSPSTPRPWRLMVSTFPCSSPPAAPETSIRRMS